MSLPKPTKKPPIALLRAVLGYAQRLKVVDVGANPSDGGRPLYTNLLEAGDIDLIGFEPNFACLESLNAKKSSNELYLPYVIGDGQRHTLHMCRADGMSSLFQPNPSVLNLFHIFPTWARVTSTQEIDTVRLDDIPETEGCDFLKMDIQGAELIALHGAVNRLRDIVAIQAETLFVPMYTNQALFSEVEQYLRQRGFMLHRFVETDDRMLSPFSIDADPMIRGSQTVWTDAVFVRDLTRLDLLTDRQLLVLATIAYDFYASFDLVLFLLREHDRRHGGTLAGSYLYNLQPFYDKQQLRVLNFELRDPD